MITRELSMPESVLVDAIRRVQEADEAKDKADEEYERALEALNKAIEGTLINDVLTVALPEEKRS